LRREPRRTASREAQAPLTQRLHPA
jgi:hypothetical protein